jgi:hypothetical protein
MRRAVRTAADQGAPCAPQNDTGYATASASRAQLQPATDGSLIGSQGEVRTYD